MTDIKYKDVEKYPTSGNTPLKEYYCPHCNQMIMKGNVRRLRMACPHCTLFINLDEKDLIHRPAVE